jgi:phage terminase large subunit-like protein
MKPNDNTKYIYTQYFIPESKLENSPDFSSGARYLEWAKKGYLKICEGNENDLSVVADWFYEIYKKYNIKLLKCGYDQRFAKDFLNRMDYYGFECEMVYQNKQTLSNPMKLLEADLKSQRINYNENPIDQWCFGNASVEVDNFGQCMAVKINNQAAKRIDGAVTTIILYEMYRRYRSEFNQYVNR